MRKWKKQWRS